jgi:hypothetical protein
VGLLAACTCIRRDSRRTLDLLDHNLTPADATWRLVLLPVAIPVGFGGLLADSAIVNPIYALDDAWDDTSELLWTWRGESTLRRVLFTPLAVLGTPVVFGCDWLLRSCLPLPPRKEVKS